MERKFHFDFADTQEIIKKIGSIDSFKGKWESIHREEDKYLKELKKLATIQSIGSSTRIEGATLSNDEIATLLANLKINKLETRDEQEAIGYYEVLEVILNEYSEISLTESNIFNLHNLLLRFSNKDNAHRGKYKQLSNKVVATYPGGEQRIVFNTTEPFLVKKEMEDLLLWYNEEMNQGIMHPLLCIAGFVYEFLSIHPFQDGNGRLSRLLTSLLLLQNGYDFIQYISFENQIESSKKKYYQVLMQAQQHRGTSKEVINDWVQYFLGSITSMIDKLENKYDRYNTVGPYLNLRQKDIVSFIEKNEPVKISDIDKRFEEYSIHSIKKDLQYLYQENAIDKIGKGKGTTYFSIKK